MLDHPPYAEHDCEAVVEHEERLQQVKLVPGPPLQDPFLRIVPREEGVVQVNYHARTKPWEDLVVDPGHLPVGLDSVAGVYEEDVARSQPVEQLERRVLHFLAPHIRYAAHATLQERLGVRIDTGEPGPPAEELAVDARGDKRGVA